MEQKLPSTKILGTAITTARKEQILEYIFKRLQKKDEKFYIVTPNPEILMYASRSKSFQDILNRAAVSLPDGIGVLLAGKMLKKGSLERITGVDMMLTLCQEASKRALTVGFLGGRDGVAEKTADCLRKKYPDLIVSFIGEEWSEEIENGELRMENVAKLDENINPNSQFSTLKSHLDILFVAFGFPRQEEWIAKNLPHIDVTVAMGVGGAFDYISGKVPRAPKIVRKAGMEWAFRLVRQPWRIRRQLALPFFVGKVLKEKIGLG